MSYNPYSQGPAAESGGNYGYGQPTVSYPADRADARGPRRLILSPRACDATPELRLDL